jgi:hypothetical protein
MPTLTEYLIEDSWDGVKRIFARLLKEWQGLCCYNRILEGEDGTAYWWLTATDPSGKTVQRLVEFNDVNTIEQEMGADLSLDLAYLH